MNKLSIKSIVYKKFRPYSRKYKFENIENIITRDSTTGRINQSCVADINYIYTIKDGQFYLASLIDPNSQKIVEHSTSKKIDSTIAIKTPNKTYKTHKSYNDLILHSNLKI